MVFGHSNFDRYELRSEDDSDIDTKPTFFKKPYMPKRWKFFRTTGKNPVFTYKGSAVKTNSVAFKLPKWMRPYLRDAQGNSYPTTPLGYTELTLGSGDYLTMGGITISATDLNRSICLATIGHCVFKTQKGPRW